MEEIDENKPIFTDDELNDYGDEEENSDEGNNSDNFNSNDSNEEVSLFLF